MPLTPDELTANAQYQSSRLPFVSIHTADPGIDGSNEATGGSPAYARVALDWVIPSDGLTETEEVTINLPAGEYTHFGFFSQAVGGQFRGGNPMNAVHTLGAQGQIKITLTLPATSA